MLSKDVCMRCKNNFNSPEPKYQWSEGSEEFWVSGEPVACPVKHGGSRRDDNPPADCPHKLEHAVYMGMDNA